MATTRLKHPDGRIVSVNDWEIELLRAKGFSDLSEDDLNLISEKEEYTDVGSQTAAALFGASRGISLGLSDLMMVGVPKLLGKRGAAREMQEHLRKLQEYAPEASIGGEVVGSVGSLFIPGGQLAAAGKAASYTGKAARLALAAGRGASTPLRGALGAGKFAQRVVASKWSKQRLGERLTGKVGQAMVREATEGAIYGAGVALSETALGKQDLISQETLMHVGLGGVFGASLPAGWAVTKPLLGKVYRPAARATQATANWVQDFTKDIVMDKAVGSVAALAAGPIGATIGGTVGKVAGTVLESPIVEEALGRAGKETLGRAGQAFGKSAARTAAAVAGTAGYLGGAAWGGLGGIRAGAELGKRAAGKRVGPVLTAEQVKAGKSVWTGIDPMARKTAEATEGIITEGLARTSAAMSGMSPADIKRGMRMPFREEGMAARRIHNLSEREFDKYAEDFTEILNKQDLEMRKVRNDIGEHIDPSLAEETDLISGMWFGAETDIRININREIDKIKGKVTDPETHNKINTIQASLTKSRRETSKEVIEVAKRTHKKQLEEAAFGTIDPEDFIPLTEFRKIKDPLIDGITRSAAIAKDIPIEEIMDIVNFRNLVKQTGVPLSDQIIDLFTFAVRNADPIKIRNVMERALGKAPKLNAKIIKRNQKAVIKAKKEIDKLGEPKFKIQSKEKIKKVTRQFDETITTFKDSSIKSNIANLQALKDSVKSAKREFKVAVGDAASLQEKKQLDTLLKLEEQVDSNISEILDAAPSGSGFRLSKNIDAFMEIYETRRPYIDKIDGLKKDIERLRKSLVDKIKKPSEVQQTKYRISLLEKQAKEMFEDTLDENAILLGFPIIREMWEKETSKGLRAAIWKKAKPIIKREMRKRPKDAPKISKEEYEKIKDMAMSEGIIRKAVKDNPLLLPEVISILKKAKKKTLGKREFVLRKEFLDNSMKSMSKAINDTINTASKIRKVSLDIDKKDLATSLEARLKQMDVDYKAKAESDRINFKDTLKTIERKKAEAIKKAQDDLSIGPKIDEITKKYNEQIKYHQERIDTLKDVGTKEDIQEVESVILELKNKKLVEIDKIKKDFGIDPGVDEIGELFDAHLKNPNFYGRNAKKYQVFYDHAIPYDESYRQLQGSLIEDAPYDILGQTKEGVLKTDRGYFEKAGVKKYLENIHLDEPTNRNTNKALGAWLKQSNNFLNKANELQIKGVRPTPDAKNLELLQKKIVGVEPTTKIGKAKKWAGVGKVEGPELDEFRTRAALKAYKEKSPFLNEAAWIGLMYMMGGPLGAALTTGARMLANPAFASRVLSSLENIHRITDGRIANSLKLFIKAPTEKVKAPAKKIAFARNPALQAVLTTKLHPGGYDTQEDLSKAYKNRFEEISEWIQDPAKLEDHLTLNTQGMANFAPGITDEFNQAAMNSMNYLWEKAPKQLKLDSPTEYEFNASPSEIYKWARTLHAVDKPLDVLDDLAEGRNISQEAVNALQNVYPALYSKITMQLQDLIAEKGTTLSYGKKLQASILLNMPVTQMMNDESLRLLQTPYEYPETEQAPKKGSKKMKLPKTQTDTNRILYGQEK